MAQSSSQIKQFEDRDLYHQWLCRRQAWPMRLDRVLMPWLWIVAFLLLAWMVWLSIATPATFVWHGVGIGDLDIIVLLGGFTSGAVIQRWTRRAEDTSRRPLVRILFWFLRFGLILLAWWFAASWLLVPIDSAAHGFFYIGGIVLWLMLRTLWRIRQRFWPMRLDRLSPLWLYRATYVYLAWWAVTMLLARITNVRDFSMLVAGIFSLLVGVFPLVATILDFLVFLPKCVHDDTSSTMMQAILHAPLPTREIVSGLRRWAIRLNLRHLAPSLGLLVGVLVLNFFESRPSSTDLRFAGEFLLKAVLPFSVLAAMLWWFLLETGIAAAALPRWATVSGAVLLLWIIPVLVAVFWIGTVLGERTVFMMQWGRYSRPYEYVPSLYACCYIVLTIPPLVLAWIYAHRLMKMRRRGQWS